MTTARLSKRLEEIAAAREIAEARTVLDRVIVWARATQLRPDHELDRIRDGIIRDLFPGPGESLATCKQRIAERSPGESAASRQWWREFEAWDARQGRSR
jgi:hypothetical protein